MGQPPSVQLLPAHIIRQFRDALGIGFPQHVQVIDVVGFKRGIGFQLSMPIPFFRLNGQKVVCAIFNGLLYPLGPIFLPPRRRRRRDR